jgi:integrase
LASIRVIDVAGVWLTGNITKRQSSIARHQSILDHHILPLLGAKPIGSVTRADVQRVVNDWTTAYAPGSTVRMYAVVLALFSYAEDSELIARTPCRRIRLPHLAPRVAEILDAEALSRLSDAMGSCGPMVYLGAFGLRWGEIAGLRVGRLDFLRHTITIDRQKTRGRGRMIETDPKTQAGRRAALALPEWLMAMFAEGLAARGVSATEPDALLFISPDGTPLHYSNWRIRVWLPARAAVGLPTLNFHDLKHTAGTALLDEGINIKTAQTRFGHANPRDDPRFLCASHRSGRP